MGCYDTVWIPCPKCNESYGAQSKSGPCALSNYQFPDAPAEIMADVNRHAPFHCQKCGTVFEVAWNKDGVPLIAKTTYRPRTNHLFGGTYDWKE